MRSLAHVERIDWISPVEGKDRIELVGILGYQVLVKKDEFKVGDLCVYIECDSVLPHRPEFEFLRPKNFRIKTMKMGGVLSQGICFPLTGLGFTVVSQEVPDVFVWTKGAGKNYKIEVGTDVTELLEIKQYERTMDKDPECIERPFIPRKFPKFFMKMNWFRQWIYKRDHREAKGFPKFISKTNECRIENMPHLLKNKSVKWTRLEKVDGSSCTFVLVKRKKWYGKKYYEFIVCSRNLRLWNKDDSVYWKIVDKYNIKNILEELIGDNEWVCIQGEAIASNIQGNKYKVTSPDFYPFNLIYPNGRLGSLVANSILSNKGLKFVPILDSEMILPDTIDEMHTLVNFESKIYPTLAEGCVFRSLDGKQSFKSVNPLFLIKHNE